MDLMNKNDVLKYLVDRKIFPKNASFKCVDILAETKSEGFCNKLFRVIDLNTNQSVIVKQVMPYMLAVEQATGKIYPFSLERINTEISVLTFFNQLQKGVAPEIFLADFENGIFLMEDLSHLRLMRFEMTEGKTFPDFGKKCGAFLATLFFFTSKYVLTPEEQKTLMLYFESSESDRLNNFLSDEECPLINLTKLMEPEVMPIRKRIADNPEIHRVIEHLRNTFFSKECMAHNDLHSSNIMIDDEEFKIIDTEFSGFSCAYIDIGRMASSFIVNFLSWIGRTEISTEKRQSMQQYNLCMLKDLFNSYKAVLNVLWRVYDIEDGFNKNFESILKDALAYAVTMTILRVSSDIAKSVDIKEIRSRENLAKVQQIAYEIAEYVILNIDCIDSIEYFTNYLSEKYFIR